VLSPELGYSFGPITQPAFGLGIHGLVYGTILGAFLYMAIQIPGLLRYRFRWSPSFGLHDARVRRVLTLMGPRILTVLSIQMVFIIQDNLASRLPTGAVSALVFGWLILQVPETLIGTAMGTALLPTLSEQVARNEQEAYTATLNRSIRAILALTLPLTVLIALVLPPVVQILGFDSAGTELVIQTARLFLLGLLGHTLLEIAVRSYYARQDALTPLAAAIGMVLVLVALALPLSKLLGAPGIALANSIAFTAQAFVLIYLLNRQLGRFLQLGSAPLRILAGALVGGLACYGVLWLLSGLAIFGNGLIPGLLSSALAALVGALVTLPFIWPEIRLLLRL
jgi:putative peptidoglycan lipid II flippase